MVEKKTKMAIIAGASHALAIRNANPRLTDEEVINLVSRETAEIVKKLDTE
jgi:hypothetical protein